MVPLKMENESSNQNNSMQSRLILECQELYDQYKLCRARLHQLAKEMEALRQENSDLSSANRELVEHLSLLSEAKMRENFLSYEFQRLSAVGEEGCDISPTSVIQRKVFRRNTVDGVSLPKSISVRSSCYLKMNHSDRSNKTAFPRPFNDSIARAKCGREQQGSHDPRERSSAKKEKEKEKEAAAELEVYNQGMFKTELCNKWQETGTCPYGDLCQFAHGITELRPIIRHPRYKTQVCRMVLAGATCPYGHRCHFRHSLCPP